MEGKLNIKWKLVLEFVYHGIIKIAVIRKRRIKRKKSKWNTKWKLEVNGDVRGLVTLSRNAKTLLGASLLVASVE